MMEHDVADEVADGRLVQVLADWCPSYPGCRLYYPDRRVTPALRALISALRL
jgi:DNA-binding transcriptional LysR family regulator